ncbi:MAG: glycosyltransferase family 9 protein [Bdellovibrionia bacterium]
MKTLVISILRIGDLLMQKPLLQSLKDQGHEVHVLMNKQFQTASELVADVVDKFFYFDRELYQKSAGEAQYNILYGSQLINELITELNSESYINIYNFTHTRLSAVLTGAIGAKTRFGAHYLQGTFHGNSSPWAEYFNTHFSAPRGSLFHYTDLLAKMFNLKVKPFEIRQRSQRNQLIFLQCFTSDKKKNWNLKNFVDLKKAIEEKYPFHLVKVLAAPQEVRELSSYFESLDIWECDLATVAMLLKEASLLIGLDTSLKHLAAIQGTPVVEINLGSADNIKTSVYSQKIWQVSSNVGCSPCAHATACPQSSHLCGEQITPQNVLNAVQEALALRANDFEQDLESDRLVWEIYLQGYSERRFQPSATYLARTLKLMEWQVRLEKALTANSRLFNVQNLQKDDVADFILLGQEILKSKSDKGAYFLKLTDALIHTPPRGDLMLRELEKAAQESRTLLKIRSDFSLGVKSGQNYGTNFEVGA